MKRINIVLDETLIDGEMEPTGIKTQRELIDLCSQRISAPKRAEKPAAIKGEIPLGGDLNEMRISKYTS